MVFFSKRNTGTHGLPLLFPIICPPKRPGIPDAQDKTDRCSIAKGRFLVARWAHNKQWGKRRLFGKRPKAASDSSKERTWQGLQSEPRRSLLHGLRQRAGQAKYRPRHSRTPQILQAKKTKDTGPKETKPPFPFFAPNPKDKAAKKRIIRSKSHW